MENLRGNHADMIGLCRVWCAAVAVWRPSGCSCCAVPCVLSAGGTNGTSGTKLELLDFIWNKSGTKTEQERNTVKCASAGRSLSRAVERASGRSC